MALSATMLKNGVNENKLTDHVRFIGERRDVPSVLRAFDVFAYYTTKDAFGNVILEAVAAGIPVVTTDVEGTSEALGNAPGSLVPWGDLKKFSFETASWLKKRDSHSNYTLPDHFTREGMVARYADIYKNSSTNTSYNGKISLNENVTILIPMLNHASVGFKEALESIIVQTHPHWKLFNC